LDLVAWGWTVVVMFVLSSLGSMAAWVWLFVDFADFVAFGAVIEFMGRISVSDRAPETGSPSARSRVPT
jgi:hypothetical protein